jgi:hypothetical protein
MIADGLTKASLQALLVLQSFLQKQRWRLVFDEKFLSARKRAAAGKDIFDEVDEDDIQEARRVREATRLRESSRKEQSTAPTERGQYQ